MGKWNGAMRGALAGVLSVALLVAGCSGSKAPAAAEKPGVDLTKKESLKVTYSATIPNFQDIQLYVAQEKGLYAKYGLEVEIIHLNGATPTLQALISGDTDVAFLDPTHLLSSQEKQQNLKGIVNTSPTQPYMLLARPGIKDLKDLTGKRIGISQPGTLSQSIIQLALAKYGIAEKGIQWMAVGGSGPRYQALVADKIDAGIAQVSHSLKGEKEKEPLKVVADLGKELPDLMGYLYVAKQSTIDQKRGALVKFAAANLEATRLILKDAEMAAGVYMAKSSGLEKASVLKEYEILKAQGAWNPEGGLKESAVTFTAKMMINEGHLKAVPKVEQIFAREVLDAAIKVVEAGGK